MASKKQQGILYTYPGNFRAYKAQIAAQYSGAILRIADDDEFIMNKTNQAEEYIRKFPTGKVPAYENDDGVYLFESSAIAYYLSNDQLRGKTLIEQSEILQWIEYSNREINPVSTTLVYPCMGILQLNKTANERAKEELRYILQLLNNHLHTRTYLVGDRITLADITIVCDLLLLFQWIIEPSIRQTYSNVTRWFSTLIHQKEFENVIGTDYRLCEKMAQFDGRKYAELQRQQTNVNDTKHEKKQSKKQEIVAAPAAPAIEPSQVDDETDEIYADEPKQKDPFADMPKTTFNIDEFKRIYSNQDTAEVAIPYFWKNFDNDHCSIWFCEYKYPEELTKVFMTCNLVTGFFQRLDRLRKNAFGSMCVFGDDDNNTIAGIWFWRGHELAFKLSADCQVDYESYTWTRLSIDEDNTKKLVNQYFLWQGEHNGKRFNQGKIFK